MQHCSSEMDSNKENYGNVAITVTATANANANATQDKSTSSSNLNSSSVDQSSSSSSSIPPSSACLPLLQLPDNAMLYMLTFVVSPRGVDMSTFNSIQQCCKKMMMLINCERLWYNIPMTLDHAGGRVNWEAFKFIKMKSHGSEGVCYHSYSRSHRCEYAIIKKARAKIENDGIHYCFIRELAALKQLSHPGICELIKINLASSKLHLFFPYIEMTLQDALKTCQHIPKHNANRYLGQLLDAIDYCHCRGIVHRNLKPKHILFIPGNGDNIFDGATLKLADFAYVRMMPCPNEYSTRVITLWYRCPEILLGKKDYTSAVDVWSAGCIYAEMLQGYPLFAGLSEIDQLFKIFSRLGTPSDQDWAEFPGLPYYQDNLFPSFEGSKLEIMSDIRDEEMVILGKCFRYDCTERATAAHLLRSHGVLLGVDNDNNNDNNDNNDNNNNNNSNVCDNTTMRQYSFLYHLDMKADACNSSRGATVSAAERLTLVEWLTTVMHSFRDDIDFHERTVFFSVAMFDKYLASVSAEAGNASHSDSIRLIGATCLLIASKCEDVSFITFNHLAERSMDSSELDDQSMLLMEERILNCLDFDVYIPTVVDFLSIFLSYLRESDLIEAMKPFTSYLAEATLIYNDFTSPKKSILAAAIICYTQDVFATSSWPTELENLTHFQRHQLQDLYIDIKNMHTDLYTKANSVIYERFLDSERCQVSLIKPLP